MEPMRGQFISVRLGELYWRMVHNPRATTLTDCWQFFGVWKELEDGALLAGKVKQLLRDAFVMGRAQGRREEDTRVAWGLGGVDQAQLVDGFDPDQLLHHWSKDQRCVCCRLALFSAPT